MAYVCRKSSVVLALLSFFGLSSSQVTQCRLNGEIYYEFEDTNVMIEMEGKEVPLNLRGQASLKYIDEYETEMRVRRLAMSDTNGKRLELNTLELPVTIFTELGTRHQMIRCSGWESDFSNRVKVAIKKLLPKTPLAQEDNGLALSLIQNTLDLLEEGKQKFILDDTYKEAILVLGNKEAGKTTFTQWIAGYGDRLIAKEIEEGDDEYTIENNINSSNTNMESKNIFPKLIIDKDGKHAYYDFPSSGDTRDPSYSIASSYFTKKTIDHVKSIKLVFVINYSSVRKGVDRKSFLILLRHITKLVKDFDKFRNSTAIVVTKVDNQYVIKHHKPVLVSDDKVINGVTSYLMDAKLDLEQRIKERSTSSAEELNFYENAIKFIDAILIKEGDNYTKIGIFRRPNTSGPLNNMDFFQNEHEYIKKNIIERLSYAEKDVNDIDTTFSDKALNEVSNLIQKVDEWVLFTVCDVAAQVQEKYVGLSQEIKYKLISFNKTDLMRAEVTLSEALEQINEFNTGYETLQNTTQSIKNAKYINDILNIFKDELHKIDMNISTEALSTNMRNQEKYLNILQNIAGDQSNGHVNYIAWASPFVDLTTYLSNTANSFHTNIDKLKIVIDEQIDQDLEKINESLVKHYTAQEDIATDLSVLHSNLMAACYDLENKTVDDIFEIVNVTFSKGLKEYVIRHNKYSEQLNIILQNMRKHVCESQVWYNFLTRLYFKLSTYGIQLNLHKYNSTKDDIRELEENKMVSETALESILGRFYKDANVTGYKKIQNITLDTFKLRHLQRVIGATLELPSQSCDPHDTLTITGNHIKLSDVFHMSCPKKVKVIKIFAMHIFYIDTNFDAKGDIDQFVVMAPTWKVKGDMKSIVLNASPHLTRPTKAPNGVLPGEDGKDGAPGFPGKAGGNFFGIAKLIYNIDNVAISSVGSDALAGQNGGDGAKGFDAPPLVIYDPKQYLKDHNLYYDNTEYKLRPIYYEWIVHGENCSNGGDAGRGGTGAEGGFPGYIDIFNFNASSSSMKTKSVQGISAPHGTSGVPGAAGKRGQYAKLYHAPLKFWDHMDVEYFDQYECLNGNFQTELNTEGLRAPERRLVRDSRSNLINEYKTFFTKNLDYSVVKMRIYHFQQILDGIYSEVEELDQRNPYNLQ